VEYSLPPGSFPNALTLDRRGTVWISSTNNTLFSLDPVTGKIKNYEIPSSLNYGNFGKMVWAMDHDANGQIWFSQLGTNSIWKFNPLGRNFTQLQSESGSPFQMKVGNNGEIWFSTLNGNAIGVVQKLDNPNYGYKVSAFKIGNNTNPSGIFLLGNSVWISEIRSQKIGHYSIKRAENGSVTDIPLIQNVPNNNDTLFSSPTDLVVNKDVVWLTEHGTSFLTSYNLNTGKMVRYPTSQNSFQTITLPFWIRQANNPTILWFNEHQGSKIARFDLNNNTMTEYVIHSLPKGGYITYPLNLSIDPNDEKILWFSEWNTDKVGVIDGNIPIPFELDTSTKKIVLNSGTKASTLDVEIQGSSPSSGNKIFFNSTSSITPTAELGNLTVRFSSDVLDISHNHKIRVLIQDGGVPAGNYTLGISGSDGSVIRTIFLDLAILKS
jgi:streptogramin lyase